MAHCPCCGYSLDKDRPVERDGFLLDPRGFALFRGVPLPLSCGEATILHSVAAEDGRIAGRDALNERIGSDTDSNVLDVLVCRARRKCRDAGAPDPIKTHRARGYSWTVALTA